MNAKNIIFALVIGIIGVIIGAVGSEKLFCKKDCKETCSTQKEITFREKLYQLLGQQPSSTAVMFSPVRPDQNDPESIKDAHKFSILFREDKRNNFCPIASDGTVKVNANQLGFFEISTENTVDLLGAMDEITHSVDAANKPVSFRVINGKATADPKINDGFLMVVPLDINGKEILAGKDGKSTIYKLKYPIDCPTRCDYVKSDIITHGGDPCN